MRHNNNSTFNESPLRRERLRRGLTQLMLASSAGCCLNTISLAERGAAVSSRMVERLAEALGISPDVVRPVKRRTRRRCPRVLLGPEEISLEPTGEVEQVNTRKNRGQ